MSKLGWVAVLLAALTGCFAADTWSSRVEEPYLPPEPPEQLLRQPADFRVLDVAGKREFFLYFYEDEGFREEVVLVLNLAQPERDRRPRLAMLDEHDIAISLFLQQWRELGDEEKLRYFNETHQQDRRRSASLLDQQIRLKSAEMIHLVEERRDLEADLKSRKETNTFAGGDEKLNLASTPALEQRLARVNRRILEDDLLLRILEYKRDLRDAEYAHEVYEGFVLTGVKVADLVGRYSTPARLVDDIRQHVEPLAWTRAHARIEYAEGTLIIRQTRDIVARIREYVDQLRAGKP